MSTEQILRIDRPNLERIRAVIAAHVPVIFTGMLDDQIAQQSWDIPYLRSKLGEQAVKVIEQDTPRIHWDPTKGLPLRNVTFNTFADDAFVRKNAEYCYLQHDVAGLPSIKGDYVPLPIMREKGVFRGKFWMSNRGLVTPLHYDAAETLHWVIRGSKRFLCYPPGVRKYYPYPTDTDAPFISQVDPDHPDLKRFPRFASAKPVEFHVNAGEILYLPSFWWHQVYSEADMNISLNFVWLVSTASKLRHLPQYLRQLRHLRRAIRQTKALQQQK